MSQIAIRPSAVQESLAGVPTRVSGWDVCVASAAGLAALVGVACLAGVVAPGQNGAWLAYVLAAVAVPVVAAWVFMDAAARPDPSGRAPVAATLALSGAVPAAILRTGMTAPGRLALACLAGVPVVALASRPWRRPGTRFRYRQLASRSGSALLAAVLIGALVAQLRFDAPRPSTLGEWAGALLLVGLVAMLVAVPRPPVPVRWGRLVDALIAIVILGVVATLRTHLDLLGRYHHDYYVGPALDVLHGRTVLVDTASQYGVGAIYFIAGVVRIAGTSMAYSATTVLGAFLAAVECCLAYALSRRLHVDRPLAAAAAIVVVAAVVYGQVGSIYEYPSTGMLRFGIAVAAVLAASYLNSPPRRAGYAVLLAVLALAAVWSAETLIYTAWVFAATVAAAALELRHASRSFIRPLISMLMGGVATVVVAVVVVAVVTHLRAGAWPDPGLYIPYLRAYSVEGRSTVGVQPWTPWLVVAAPALATITILIRRWSQPPRAADSQSQMWVTAAAVAALGVIEVSYWITRMDANNLRHVAMPAIVLSAWLVTIARVRLSAGWHRAAGAIAVATATLWLISAVPLIDVKAGEALLPASLDLVRGGPGIKQSVDTPIAPGEAATVHLIRVLDLPDRVPIDVDECAEIPALLATNRANWLPFEQPSEAAIDPGSLGRARDAVSRLQRGQWVVLQRDRARLAALGRFYGDLVAADFTIDAVVDGGEGIVAERIGAPAQHPAAVTYVSSTDLFPSCALQP